MDVTRLKIREMRDMLDKKEISSVELTNAYLERIKKYDSEVESYITVAEEKALRNAEAADEKIKNGSSSPLCGIPMAIKDNICTEGIRTTASSKMLGNFIPPYNATVMENSMLRIL